jgi:PBP1b-binding outer membrane lipoprotein LpoB
MKEIITLCLILIFLNGCVDQVNRQKHVQKLYPNCKVEPATGIIQQNGYDFIVIDSTNQIIAVDFYMFSETKIMNLRNIR